MTARASNLRAAAKAGGGSGPCSGLPSRLRALSSRSDDSPNTSYPLSSTNTNPQGIADPPAGLGTAVASGSSINSAFDAAILGVVDELEGLLMGGKKRK